MLMGIGYWLLPYFGDGPVYKPQVKSIAAGCKDYWWTNILYINNMVPWNLLDECFGWVWYLANDMQFFIVTPPIIMLYCRHRKAALAFILTSTFLSCFITFMFAVTQNYGISFFHPTTDDKIPYSDTTYVRPWARYQAYGVGLFAGLMHFEYKYQDKYPEMSGSFGARYMNAVREGRYLPTILFLLGAFICQFLIWIRITIPNMFERSWPVPLAALYNGFSMGVFVIGLILLMQPFFAGRLESIRPLLGGTIY